ncbi:DNA-directed DNA polymerase, partial [Tanacetum coccineum]
MKNDDLKQVDVTLTKSSIEEPPKLELKDLPSHLECAFLEGTDKLPIIISKELKDEEKAALLKILMEDDFKPAVQHQRRVNPKIHEVIKKEVIKLHDTGLIYPISDSLWVSPVHCVPKKVGITVIENKENELIPTRCMMAIFHDMIEETMEVFMDDFLVFGDSFSSCLSNLDKMLKRCEDTNLILNWEKCHFMVKEGIVLGHKISKSGIEVDRAKVDVIAKLPHLTSVKRVRSFLGHARPNFKVNGHRLCWDLKMILRVTTAQYQAMEESSIKVGSTGEYEMWVIRIKQYFQVQDYALWEVIENGNSWVSVPQTTQENGTLVTKMSVPVTAEEKANKKNDLKARNLLLMALPNEHQLTFISTASFSNNVVYAFMVENFNGSILLQQDLEQIHEVDWMHMEFVKSATLSAKFEGRGAPKEQRGSSFKNQGPIRKHGTMKDTSSKVQTNMALMAFSDSKICSLGLHSDIGFVDNGCSRHMTGNIAYLLDFKEFDEGYVTFRGGTHGGRISSKGTLKTDCLDFKDVYFVNELKFNLFSVSQMCDKKNYVLFIDTECLFLSPNFKLPDESQILLKIPRKDNMYSFDIKNIVPKENLTCLIPKATLDESMLWEATQSLLEKGIRREYIVARTPQQNGVAEKRNRTLIEAARTMLADFKLPTTFWAEAVSTACYVQNRVLVV